MPDLSLRLLQSLGAEPNFNNLIQGFRQREGYGTPQRSALVGPSALSSARSNFALGDYETASFAAMKAVEVEVRRVARLPNELLGVNLMRNAFSPKDGVLRDPGAEGGEQQATADLSPALSATTRTRPATEPSSSTTRWKQRKCSSWPICATITRKLVSLTDAPQILAVSTKAVRCYIADGHLEAVRLGRKTLRIKFDSIERFIDARPVGGWRRAG